VYECHIISFFFLDVTTVEFSRHSVGFTCLAIVGKSVLLSRSVLVMRVNIGVKMEAVSGGFTN